MSPEQVTSAKAIYLGNKFRAEVVWAQTWGITWLGLSAGVREAIHNISIVTPVLFWGFSSPRQQLSASCLPQVDLVTPTHTSSYYPSPRLEFQHLGTNFEDTDMGVPREKL